MNPPDEPRRPYEVGHGKPPKHRRFKPGQSGNPGGRQRGSQNLKTLIARIFTTEIETTGTGRKRKVPIVEALILSQVQLALRGNARAIDSLLDRAERYEASTPAPEGDIATEDAGILTRFLAAQGPAEGPTVHPPGVSGTAAAQEPLRGEGQEGGDV